jgi:hypothetical protein
MRTTLALVLTILVAGLAQAQVPTMLVQEGAPLPNAPDYQVTTISTPDVNGAEGWSFTCTAVFGSETLSLAYGTLLGGEPGVIRTEQPFIDYIQDSWESFFGMADTDVCYSPSCTRVADGEDGLDSVWFGDVIVAIEEEPYPHQDGWFWRFGSRPGVTRDGIPYFVGGITDVQGGSTQVRGLFYGIDGAPIVIGGMAIGGLPDPVSTNTSAVGFDFRFSAYGTHYIAEVQTDTGDFNTDNHIVMDQAVVLAGGMPMSESGMVPEEIGGLPGESWDNWDYLGVTENGDWMVTGDTDAATDQDEFLVVNGQIILREGDLVDGMMLDGTIERAFLGEDGDWAAVWGVDIDGSTVDVLLLNGEIVLMEGMPVDLDGDFVPEDDTMVTDLTGSAALVVSDRDAQNRARVYFTADVEFPGAGRQPVEAPVLADEELGFDATPVVEPGSRIESELGLMFMTEGSVAIEDPELPGDTPAAKLALEQNYPNPFNPQTTIAFSLPHAQPVRLAIHDLQGRLVRTLVDERREAGAHSMLWDGTNEDGQRVASGTYMYRLETADRLLTRTMVLVK